MKGRGTLSDVDLPFEIEYNGCLYRDTFRILRQLQNSSFKGFALDSKLFFLLYNYKKEAKDRLYFYQREYNIHLSFNIHVFLP